MAARPRSEPIARPLVSGSTPVATVLVRPRENTTPFTGASPTSMASGKASPSRRLPSTKPAPLPVLKPAQPAVLSVPSVGIRADVRKLLATHDETGWQLAPPEATIQDLLDAYWWPGWKSPTEMNQPSQTEFGLAHTCRGASCKGAFDTLQNVQKGGFVQLIMPDGSVRTYKVDWTATFSETEIQDPVRAARVWASVPNRLVLMTCKLQGMHVQTDRFVASASLVGYSPA